jgi:hypothetical protein
LQAAIRRHTGRIGFLKENFYMRSRLGGSWLCALACLLLVAVTSPASAQIELGFQAPLTGPAATDGKSAKIAADMAVEKINSAGVLGQKIEFITYDDQAKTEEAVFTANKLGPGRREICGIRKLLGLRSRRCPHLPASQCSFHFGLRGSPRHYARRQLRLSRRSPWPSSGAGGSEIHRRQSRSQTRLHRDHGQRLWAGDL